MFDFLLKFDKNLPGGSENLERGRGVPVTFHFLGVPLRGGDRENYWGSVIAQKKQITRNFDILLTIFS